MNKLGLFLSALIIILNSCQNKKKQPIKVSSGSIDFIESFESKYIDERSIRIWLPENYSNSNKYPVLYMHDGQMLFDSTTSWNKQEWGVDEVLTTLINENKVKPCIVVGIDNNGDKRHSEYFPKKPFLNFSNEEKNQLLSQCKDLVNTDMFNDVFVSDEYLKMLVTELKPYIDRTYTTKSDKANTFIAGSSMGGLISMYAMCEYPNVFGAAAGVSTHWIGTYEAKNNPIPKAFQNYMRNNLPAPSNGNKWYFDYGTETLDALYEPYQLQVDEVMKAKGYTDINWQSKKFEGHDHSERSWNKRLDTIFEFIMN